MDNKQLKEVIYNSLDSQFEKLAEVNRQIRELKEEKEQNNAVSIAL